MKRWILLFLSVVLWSCDQMNHQSEFDKSFQKWQSFKASSHNSYSFSVINDATLGQESHTELVVQNGEVVERHFFYDSYNGIKRPINGWDSVSIEQILLKMKDSVQLPRKSELKNTLEWTEKAVSLGSHNCPDALEIINLDAIYRKVKTNWLHENHQNSVFEGANNGLISLAGYYDQHHHFVGIKVDKIN